MRYNSLRMAKQPPKGPIIVPHKIPSAFLISTSRDMYAFSCMEVLALGKNTVNNTEALVYEDVSNNLRNEFRRKIRIATGDFQNLAYFLPLVFSTRKGLAFSFISHKVLRWLTPCLFILFYISNLILLFNSTFYLIIFVLFNLLLLLIPLDFILKKKNIHNVILRFITHFFSMNLALLIGMIHAIRGNNNGIWEPTERNQQ